MDRVYEFLRNNDLDAPNYFDAAARRRRSSAISSASRLAGPIQKDKTFIFANYEGFRQSLHQTSRGIRARRQCSRACLQLVVPQRSLAVGSLNLWPTAAPAGAPDFSGIAEVFSSPLQTIREDFGTARWITFFAAGLAVGGVHHRRRRRRHGHHARSLQHGYARLREQVLSLEETHRFFADPAEHGALRLFARRLFFPG